jgi:hypothetical protein
MNRFTSCLSALTLSLASFAAMAVPSVLITHNLTDVESNAYVAGVIPSTTPSKAHSTNRVPWIVVQMACYGHTVNGKCSATIKMASNTASPIELGEVFMNMTTGEITPSALSANGFLFTVNGPGEATLTRVTP